MTNRERALNKGEELVIEYFYAIVVDPDMRDRLLLVDPSIKQRYTDLVEYLAASESRAREAEADCAAMRDWCAGWLIRAREAIYREGWEEGMSETEAADALTDVLANLGCDAGTEDPAQVAEAERLLKLDLSHSPPDSGAALLAELEAARELSQVADDHCPHAVRECTLKDALAKYRAARGAR